MPLRRFLSIVLMLVLSLQATWSMAASVCLHDVAAQTPHLGHHAHADGAAQPAVAGPQADAAGTQIPHLDCVGCHGGLCSGLLGTSAAMKVDPPGAGVATPYQRSITHGQPERLIRPPHFFLA